MMKNAYRYRSTLSKIDDLIDLVVLLTCICFVLYVLGSAAIRLTFTESDALHLFLAVATWYLVDIKHAVMGRIK